MFCPRLSRNAGLLAALGHEVVTISTLFPASSLPQSQQPSGVPWRHEFVNLADGSRSRWHWMQARRRRKFFSLLPAVLMSGPVALRACCHAGPELARLAAGLRADVYFAHTHAALPVAAAAARDAEARLVFDAEDMLAESSAEPVALMDFIERRHAPRCDLVLTMSVVAAERLQSRLALAKTPMVLHNTPFLAERTGLVPPDGRLKNERVSFYWFGQRVGAHSCADQILRAMAKLSRPSRLVLRGTPEADFVGGLEKLAGELGLRDALEIHPRAAASDMVRLAGEHDVCFGTQPSDEPFHQLAVGNKVFTGLLAGCAVGLTDTVAHRRLMRDMDGAAFLFPNNDPTALAQRLEEILSVPEKLQAMKRRAWELGGAKFNWEIESAQLADWVRNLAPRTE